MTASKVPRIVKRMAEAILPARAAVALKSVASRNTQAEWLRANGYFAATETMISVYGTEVLHGPFAGMKYPRESLLSRNGTPLLLGAYEEELHPIINNIVSGQYDAIIDIGAAEGYYAVGLARKARSPVYAFEAEPRERRRCREMARLNGVERSVLLKRWCDPPALSRLAADKRCFVLSDCEGYEAELFAASSAEALRKSNVVVELHSNAGRDIGQVLCERFGATHSAEFISVTQRNPTDYPELATLKTFAELAVLEHREEGQQWLHLRSRI